jgi:hypothetical protein
VHAARRVAAALFGVVAALALIGQFRMPLTGDVAFHLDAARRLLEGAVLYQDVSAPETPFVFWAAVPAAAIGGSGADAGTVYRAMTAVVVLATLGLLVALTRGSAAMRAGFVLVALVLPVWYFATPEHLAFVLLVPYVALVAARWDRGDPSQRLAIASGLLAVAAVALEPALVTAVASLAGLEMWRTRSARALRAPEHLAIGSGLVVAAALVLGTTPGFIEAVREAGRSRALAPVELGALLTRDIHVWTVGLALGAAALFGASVRERRGITVLAAATSGALLSAVLQRTGEGPDFYPALGFAVMLLTTLGFAERRSSPRAAAVRRVTAALMLVPMAYLFGAVTWRRAHGVFTRNRADQLVVMRMLGPERAAVAVLSADIGDAYPVVLERGHRFVPRYPSFWAAKLPEGDSVRSRVYREYGDDLHRVRPAAIVVRAPDAGQLRPGEATIDYLELLCRDDVARETLSGYRLAERAGGFELYRPGAEGAAACVSS